MKVKILLLGCGNMGYGMLKSWLSTGEFSITVVEPFADLSDLPGVQVLKNIDDVSANLAPDIIVMAVKPQIVASVLPSCAVFANAVVISIAAGITIEKIAQLIGKERAISAIVRAMPNLPASIGRGATVAVASQSISEQQRELAHKVLAASGLVIWGNDESQIDAVTALSGSGPAYIFAVIEAMVAAGIKLGLSDDMANALARQTLVGSAALLEHGTLTAEQLRVRVTSPGGTTAAALGVLQDKSDGLNQLIERAMMAAKKRSEELRG